MVIDHEKGVIVDDSHLGAAERDDVRRARRLGEHIIAARTRSDDEGNDHHMESPEAKRPRGPLGCHAPGLRFQLFAEGGDVRMARMDVVQVTDEILRPHHHIADGAAIRLGQRSTFVERRTRTGVGDLFRNDADEARTHAYIAPDESTERTGLSPRTLSTARSKSVIVTTSRSSRIANIPASVHIAWMSAPVVPSHRAARTP